MLGARKMRWGGATTVVALIAGMLVFAGLLQPPASASAAPGGGSFAPLVAGQPGIPSDPAVVYQEDFQNGTGITPLTSYVSTSGVAYTASPYWLNAAFCNGFIVDSLQAWPGTSTCTSAGNFNDTQNKAYALGVLQGQAQPQLNRALSTNTSDDGGAAPNQIMFASQGQIALPSSNGRYITFSVDAAATACTYDTSNINNQPRLRFYFRNAAGTESPISSSAINPCTDPRSQQLVVNNATVDFGQFAANGSTMLSGSSIGLVLRNESNGGPNGNDGAIDNIRILDVTPQLDKAFSPTSVPVGGVSTLTFTVTNTSELAAKAGWSFTDSLPAGLVVANTPNVGGTCAATTTAAAGATSISIANGSLTAGQVSCTVTVDVTSSTPLPDEPSPKTYTNCAVNITAVVGLDLPNCASVEFFSQPEIQLTKTSNATADSRVGDVVEYTVTAENVGNQDYTASNPAVILDDLSGVLDDATYNGDAVSDRGGAPSYAAPLLSWSGALDAGDTVTLTYSVTLAAGGDGTARNVVWVPEDPSNPQTPSCDPPVDGTDPTTGEPCAFTSFPLPRLSIDKSADRTELPAVGDQVTYTVVVTNEGPGDYTAAAPATSTDDLSEVLDDATFDDASLTSDVGTVTRT
ncbi:MAG: hypothetical protein IJG47_08070, partial [Microbacterium sp.]|nr:hypothetical protein [Microbacterium sp.]